MMLQVYRGLVPTIQLPLDTAVFADAKMSIKELVFTMETSEVLDLDIGDNLVFGGIFMKLNFTPTFTNAGSFRKNYTITFEDHTADLCDQPLVDEGDVTFSYFGDASELLALILTNINQLDSGWRAGVVDSVEPQHFEFDNVHCLSALDTVAQTFELEWKIKDKVITLSKNIGKVRNVVLSQGRGNGLYDLTREYLKDSSIKTRAYALGSVNNLPPSYNGKRLALDGYIESNVDRYGVKPIYYTFDDVYPHRTGTATAVSKVNDKTYSLVDSSLEFDLNGQRAGENEVKIVFKSGSLNGQEFVISSYNHARKEILYKAVEDKQGGLMPSGSLVAEVGDKYTLVGLIMPDSYIDAAKAQLVAKRAESLAKDSVPKVVYSLNADVLFLKQNGLILESGDIITVKDSDIDLNEQLTIQKVSYPAIFRVKLISGIKFTAEVGNTSYAKVNDKIYKDLQDQIILSGQIKRNTAEIARENALRMRELQNMVFDSDDYFDTDRIKPLSIETSMLSVGAVSGNFVLSEVTMQPNFMGSAGRFSVSSGYLQHREIKIDAGFIWEMSGVTFDNLEPSKAYYLSAKCNKTQLIGTFNLSAEPIKVEDQEGFYNFQIGVLYPVADDGKRYFYATNGVTYIVGGQVTTGRIKSIDGNTWFDLDTGEIRGVISFASGQSVESAIEQAKGEAQASAIAASSANISAALQALSVGGRNYYSNNTVLSVYESVIEERHTGNVPNGFMLAGNQNGKTNIRFTKVINSNGWWTISGYVRGDQSLEGGFDIDFCDGDTKRFYFTSDNNWTYFEYSYNVTNYSGELYNFVDFGALGWLYYFFKDIKVEKGNKATDWTPAPEDLQAQITDSVVASKAYADAQDALKKVEANAYADGKVDAAEQRAINDATAKANAAKAYADAQDALLKAQADAYADGKITAEESARIAQAQANLQASKAYADAQDNLTKIQANAYADGVVDAEEQRAIADAQAKLNEAKGHADAQANQAQANAIAASSANISAALQALSVGGRNYYSNNTVLSVYESVIEERHTGNVPNGFML
ncbi:phage tail protein, partial [Sphingobacterium multivorum]|uniref:phage tail protein n=1 Tax=Sphingobacterium multivorum TaxID=28454 RepID=UPI003DA331A8